MTSKKTMKINKDEDLDSTLKKKIVKSYPRLS